MISLRERLLPFSLLVQFDVELCSEMSVIKVSGACKVYESDSESNQVLKNFCMNVARGSM